MSRYQLAGAGVPHRATSTFAAVWPSDFHELSDNQSNNTKLLVGTSLDFSRFSRYHQLNRKVFLGARVRFFFVQILPLVILLSSYWSLLFWTNVNSGLQLRRRLNYTEGKHWRQKKRMVNIWEYPMVYVWMIWIIFYICIKVQLQFTKYQNFIWFIGNWSN